MAGGSVADLFVVLDSVTEPFSAGMKRAAADAEAQSHRMSSALGAVTKIGIGLGAATLGVGVASVKAAAEFQATMETLHTQAGVAQDQIGGLSNGVLALAGKVGFAPNSLAEALYHIESSFASVGITGPKALNLLQIAAEGAAVGHADLVDVTNALDAAIASGIPGVEDFQQAMGVLNSVVGSGDMSMQDLANAFSTGALANVKSYGASITDVGAALAVFGDNNIRGQNAATDLRMAMQALQTPASTASVLLAKMGMDAHTLGDTMSQGGLLPALQLLHDRMTAIGMTEQTQGAALTELFGKKAGAGIVVLYDQLDRLKSKYPDQINGAKNFADAWVQTKATVSQQVKEIGAGVDALGVRIGMWLIPQVSKLITLGQTDLGQIVSGFTGADRKPPVNPGLGNAFLNREMTTAPPPLTGWQEFGEKIRGYLTDIEQGAVKLEPIGKDFLRFGDDVWQALGKIVHAAEPVAHDLGVALFAGAELAGKAFAEYLGPAIKAVGDFIDSHQTAFRVFADVILGGIALKMGVLGTINATKGLIDLATKILQFPSNQLSQITGAFGELKATASGALDKVLPDSGKLAGLAKVGQDLGGIEQGISGVEKAAEGEQLGLFETNLKGVVQVADTQQLGLFETDLSNIETTAGNAVTPVEKVSGEIGKFALAGGMAAALVGVGLLANELGHLAGVGDHTGISIETLQSKLTLAASGSIQARDEFTQAAVGLVEASNVLHKPVQGLTDMDQALAQMVTSGDAKKARDQFNDIAAALAKQGIDAQGAAAKFPQYEQAIKNAGEAAKTADGQVQGLLGTLNRQQSLDQFASDLGSLTTALQTNGATLLDSTDGAIANRRAFQQAANDIENYYIQQRNAGTPITQATADMQKQVDQLEQTGIQAGFTKGDVDSYLGTLGLIPSSIGTTITADVNPAVQALNGLIQRIDTSTGTVQVYASPANLAGGKASFDAGGFVPGAKGAAQLAVVHGGEYIVSNEMQSGRSPIDPRVLAGLGTTTPTGSGPAATAGGSVTYVTNHINIAGSVLAEAELERLVQRQTLQYSVRNVSNGLSYTAVR